MRAIICGAGIAGPTLARWLVKDKKRSGRRTAKWFVPTSQWRITTRKVVLWAARLLGATVLVRAAFRPLVASVVTEPATHRQLAADWERTS